MKSRTITMVLLATAMLLSLVSVASAQKNPHTAGTPAAGFSGNTAKQGDIFLTAAYANASYGTGGTALRNRSQGVIQISGVTGTTQAAWLYWAVLLSNPSKTQLKDAAKVTLARQFPTGGVTSEALTGTLLAIGGDPCWGSSGAYVYRAAVNPAVANGNGTYKITLNKGAVGLSDGEDPWDGNVVFPLWEGASLAIIGQGGSSVGVLDGQAGTTFVGGYSNFYELPATVGSGTQVLLDNFGYDGQIGDSRYGSASDETSNAEGWPSLTNNILFAGPGGEVTDSDWDGSSGWPLPQLWDDTGHDISNAFLAGDTWVLVSYNAPYDCVGTVAAIVSVN